MFLRSGLPSAWELLPELPRVTGRVLSVHPSQTFPLGPSQVMGKWMSGDISAVSKVEVKVMSLKGQRDVEMWTCLAAIRKGQSLL